MWYVIQTKTGEEERVVNLIDTFGGDKSKCIVPLFEQVRRNSSKCQISIRRLFPGYIFVETDDPKELIFILKKVPEFTKMLGTDPDDKNKPLISVGKEDMDFIKTLLKDDMVHASYISVKNGRIEKVVGPLAGYMGHITRLDIQHRRAIVEKDIFGKHRKIYFGLWTDNEPPHPWLEEQMGSGSEDIVQEKEYDIGIHEGDIVQGINGIYEENEMKVISVDAVRRKIVVEMELFGRQMHVPMFADDVNKIAK